MVSNSSLHVIAVKSSLSWLQLAWREGWAWKLQGNEFCKVLSVLADDETDAFHSFAKRYPFLVTKSTKAATISGYPAEVMLLCCACRSSLAEFLERV